MPVIDRSGAEALIPEEVSREIIQNVPERSAVMQLGRQLPNMPRNQMRMPVLASLVQAYFVEGEPTNDANNAGMKSVTQARWQNKYINAAEIAVIVPIPEIILDEADYDVWSEVQPRVEEGIGATFDAAVIHGTNAPSNWPDALVPGSAAAGNVVERGSVGDLYDDIFAEDGVIEQVELDGFDVTGHMAALRMRSQLRGLRDTTGQPIFYNLVREGGRYQLDGEDIIFPRNGAFDPTEALLISGDFRQLVWSIRTDISYRMLTEATLYNPDGSVMFALAQQNMVALRATFRVGWQIPNPLNAINTDDETRYPFATLVPAAGG